MERRQQPEKVALLQQVIDADTRWRELTGLVNKLRKRRNEVSAEIAQAMKAGKDASQLKKEQYAKNCVSCGRCEELCPQHLPIRNLLRGAGQVFESDR